MLRIFLRVIQQSLQTNSPGAASPDKAALHIGAVAFIHRIGSSLNEHMHFPVCVVDGVFEEAAGEGEGGADADGQVGAQAPFPGVIHPATGVSFSVDTSVCIAAHDRASLERLLRYCARPPFASERLRKAGSELVYRCANGTCQ